MKNLAAVSCTNSLGGAARAGDYDTISFSGFGIWSKDAADALPRFATVSLSLAQNAPYTGILVYQNPDAAQNVVLSGANNPPAVVTLP
jgi:hypothetical protein